MFCICEHDYVQADTKEKQNTVFRNVYQALGRWPSAIVLYSPEDWVWILVPTAKAELVGTPVTQC